MPTYTTNYNLAKPLVNDPVDQDLWGDYLNSDMDTIDSTMKSISDVTGSIAQQRVLARKTLSTGAAEQCTLSEVLDFIGSAAHGDILYRGASAWARLPAGTSGQFLQTQGAGANPQWANNSAATIAAFNAYKKVTGAGIITSWTENNDDGNIFDPTTGQFTAPTTAWYLVAASLSQNSPPGQATLELYKNGSSFIAPIVRYQDDYAAGFSQVLKLTAADYLTLNMSLISGGDTDVYFSAYRIG